MWHLGIRKDAHIILLVGIFILLSVIAVLLTTRAELPSRCLDTLYNPALITHQEGF
jgi:hypothetical protein